MKKRKGAYALELCVSAPRYPQEICKVIGFRAASRAGPAILPAPTASPAIPPAGPAVPPGCPAGPPADFVGLSASSATASAAGAARSANPGHRVVTDSRLRRCRNTTAPLEALLFFFRRCPLDKRRTRPQQVRRVRANIGGR